MNFSSHKNIVYRIIGGIEQTSHPIFKLKSIRIEFKQHNGYAFHNELSIKRKIRAFDNSINFYHFLNQSLEINDFKTAFKNPTGLTNPEKIVLRNTGEDPILIKNISVGDSFFQIEGFKEESELLPGDQLTLSLFFKPDQFGFYQSKLTIATNMKDHEGITYDLYGVRARGNSYYRYIHGVRYDRLLLEIAYSVMIQNQDNVIDYDEIKIITKNVWDAGRITTTEKRSLKYIWENYDWSDNARKWFLMGYKHVL